MRSVCLRLGFIAIALFAATVANATIFGNIRGVVHDPQHRPIAGATVQLKSANFRPVSSHADKSGPTGEFAFFGGAHWRLSPYGCRLRF